jgi:hypothetical protein
MFPYEVFLLFITYDEPDDRGKPRPLVVTHRSSTEFIGYPCYSYKKFWRQHSEVFDTFYHFTHNYDFLSTDTYVHIAKFKQINKSGLRFLKLLGALNQSDTENMSKRIDWFKSYSFQQSIVNPARTLNYETLWSIYNSKQPSPGIHHNFYKNFKTYDEVERMHSGWEKSDNGVWIPSQYPDPSNVKARLIAD